MRAARGGSENILRVRDVKDVVEVERSSAVAADRC
jgi:hypothetical protein